MAKKEQKAKNWEPVASKINSGDGKRLGTVVRNKKTGKEVTLLNPHGKGLKAAEELRRGHKLTNNFETKNDAKGNPMPLTERDRQYRVGYLNARSDSAAIYKAKGK